MKNVCAQHYHVNRLRLSNGDWLDLRNLDAMFFPLSKSAALLTLSQHKDILAGAPVIAPSPMKIEAIEYTVTACAGGNGIVTEDFLHKFKIHPRLSAKTISGDAPFGTLPNRWKVYLLEASKGSLFTTRPLDFILSSHAFGTVQGAQFCC